jgi:CBS domain-containing protein
MTDLFVATEPERTLNVSVSAGASPMAVLAQTRSFKELDRPTLEVLVAAADTYRINAGSALFREGEPFGGIVYILYDGAMRQYRASGAESEVHRGDFLALANYVDRIPFGSTVEALTDCVVLGLAADALEQLERNYPSLFNCLNRIIAHKLRARSPVRDINRGVLAQPVRSIMNRPVTCGPDTRLRDALSLIRKRSIGGLVVTDADNRLLGLLTRASLAEAVLLQEARVDDPVAPSACQDAHTVEPNTPLWQVQEMQQHFGTKYVVVVDRNVPIGVVAQSDILRALIASPGVLTPHVAKTNDLQELAELKSRLVEEAADIREANHWARAAVRFLSETHLAIQRRVVKLSLDWMQDQGDGEPPVPFAILIMGSGGRKEMLLNPDQDNGLILADAPQAHEPDTQTWFERFSHRLNDGLAHVGYPLCPGGIMARNPVYRKTLAQWQRRVTSMADNPTEAAARWSNIVFDFTTLYGDDGLTATLWRHVLETTATHPRLFTRMAADDARGRPALGFFQQLVATTWDDSGAHIDLKRNGLRLIADATRIFALQAGVRAQNTSDRLAGLVRLGTFSEAFSTSVGDAYEALLDLLLAHQIEQARAGEGFNTLIDPKTLTEQNRATLRLAMRMVKRLQDRLQETFGVAYID